MFGAPNDTAVSGPPLHKPFSTVHMTTDDDKKKIWLRNTCPLCTPFVSNNTTSEVHIHGSQPHLLFNLLYIIQPFDHFQDVIHYYKTVLETISYRIFRLITRTPNFFDIPFDV
jgi:hypothetical protein